MKKILLAGCVLLMSAGYAQAANPTVWDGSKATTNPPDLSASGLDKTALGTFKVSNGVTLQVWSDATQFASTSYHLNGTRTFAAVSGDTLMRYLDKDAGKAGEAPTAATSEKFAGWSAL